jgi:hypothetical protein
MNDREQQNDDQELQAPPRLLAALKQLPRERIFVPPAIDRAVLETARRQLVPTTGERNFFRSWMIWPVFATACAIVVAAVFVLAPRGHRQTVYSREDLNHDGRVDILDAFALARQVRDGKVTPGNPDLNGDGVVDRRDAEIIATHAVKLEKGNRS